jgi:hypothetical protein
MVNDTGQLYTIEGISAGIIIIFTAYLVLSTTTIFTPGDSHIADAQLEQWGNDALGILDTPRSHDTESPLQSYIYNYATSGEDTKIKQQFQNLWKNDGNGEINYKISFYYVNITEDIKLWPTLTLSSSTPSGRENVIRVTRFVGIDSTKFGSSLPVDLQDPMNPITQHVFLVEVLLWKN